MDQGPPSGFGAPETESTNANDRQKERPDIVVDDLQLDRPQVLCAPVDQRCLCPTHRMGSVRRVVETNRRDARGGRIGVLKGVATRESCSGTESPTATVWRS